MNSKFIFEVYQEILMKNQISVLSMLILAMASIAGFIFFKNIIIIEVGAIVFFTGFAWELYGTGKGLWDYNPSQICTIAGRVPIEILLSYLFLGMSAACYVLFRLVI